MWAYEIAKRIIAERPNEEVYTIAAGVSPSGFVHNGNFREIVTPYFVAKALSGLGKKVRFILSLDEYDRFRKVPGNIPQEYEKYIGMPYVDIPSPFTSNETYAEYFEKRFLGELSRVGIEVECIHQAQEYRSGRYAEKVKLAMDNRKKIFDIIDSFRTQDAEEGERDNFYPLRVYCEKCKKEYGDSSSFASSSSALEVTAPKANKGDALLKYCERHNIKPEEVLVCGDSGNDLTRFSKFPHSFARSQASDSFKAKANHVIKHVCDLQKYLDNPELMENDTIKN